MKFGIFAGARLHSGDARDDGAGYRAFIEYVLEAERLGYHGAFVVEHHFTGVGQISASLNLLSYLAARTHRIRLGTAVVVLPWHNPVLVAEQAATVDLLSGGRFDFGVGRGYRHDEFRGFGIPVEEASERFAEAVEIIRKAWRAGGERFSHQGPRWTFDDIVVEPPPTQRPHPPLWLAAGRPESLRGAARDGFHLLLDQFATFQVVGERLGIYREALREHGRPWDPMQVAVARALAFASTPEEREQAVARRARTLESINRHGVSPDGRSVSSMVSDPDLVKATEEGALLGPPEEIIERLRGLEREGVEYVLLANIDDVSVLRRFAEEVMPWFR